MRTVDKSWTVSPIPRCWICTSKIRLPGHVLIHTATAPDPHKVIVFDAHQRNTDKSPFALTPSQLLTSMFSRSTVSLKFTSRGQTAEIVAQETLYIQHGTSVSINYKVHRSSQYSCMHMLHSLLHILGEVIVHI